MLSKYMTAIVNESVFCTTGKDSDYLKSGAIISPVFQIPGYYFYIIVSNCSFTRLPFSSVISYSAAYA
jgi:hypothetical protein